MKYIGFMVKRFRVQQRISRVDLCNSCGISQSYLSELERGKKNNITTCVLIKLCKVLSVTPNDLIPEELYKGDKNEQRTITRGNDS